MAAIGQFFGHRPALDDTQVGKIIIDSHD
jgi:hypothetical protein